MSKAQKPSTTASRRQKERLVRKARRTERSKAATDSVPGEAKSPSTVAFSKKPESRWFLPEVLDRTVIAIPLLDWFKDPEKQGNLFDIVVDLNLNYRGGLNGARQVVEKRINDIIAKHRKTRRPPRMVRWIVERTCKGKACSTCSRGSMQKPSKIWRGTTAACRGKIGRSITSGRILR